jgi:hypothetical protein
MNYLGRSLVIFGAIILVIGLILMYSDRLPFRIGRLPGDILIKGKNTTFYFPLATGLLLSLVLTLLGWLFSRR